MGEIDDFYQERVEIIENEFFDSFKKGKKREQILEEYHKKLDKARARFEKDYSKKLTKDKIKAGKLKKKKEKAEKYKHLNVTSFDFEFGFWEKFKMKLRVFWFNISRFWRRNISDKIPVLLVYRGYKIKIFIKHILRETVRERDYLWHNFKHWFIKLVHDVWKKLVTFYHLLKKILGKMIFWKKGEVDSKKEEGEEKKDGKKIDAEEKKEG